MLSINDYKNFLKFLIKNLYIVEKNNKTCFSKKNFKKIYKYTDQIQSIINKEKNIFEFFLDDLSIFCPTVLIKIIISNTKRFIKILKEVINDIILETFPYVTDENKEQSDNKKIVSKNFSQKNLNLYNQITDDFNFLFYQIIIIPFRSQQIVPLFSLKASSIGKFILVNGIVVEINQIEYLLKKVVYKCKSCQFQVTQYVNTNNFKPLLNCPVKKCRFTTNPENFYIDANLNSIEKTQEIKIRSDYLKNIDSNSYEIMKVRLQGYLTATCKLGDIIKVAGIILPSNCTKNKRQIGQEIFLDSLFLDKNFNRNLDNNQKFLIEKEISNVFNHSGIYEKVSSYMDFFFIGHSNFKKGLLLSLVGSNIQFSNLDLKYNNNINIFIVLYHEILNPNIFSLISLLAPKYFYNNPFFSYISHLNNEDILKKKNLNFNNIFKIDFSENGITCIDNIENLEEIDFQHMLKMMGKDKAGYFDNIYKKKSHKKTTVIAATRGQNYEKKIILKGWEIDILLNFDLIFSFSSALDPIIDINIASYIINRCKSGEDENKEEKSFKLKIIKALIIEAQKGFPFISDEAFTYLIYCYVCINTKLKELEKNVVLITRIGSALKISKCLARINFQDRVYISDIKEAFRLLKTKNFFLSTQMIFDIHKKAKKIENKIFKIIRSQFVNFKTCILNITEIEKKILAAGFSNENLVKCISFYEEINRLKIDVVHGKIYILS
nr:minichromosome maintenance component complex 7-like protein [Cryptomonas curvata]